jgi:hypothetical protein
VHVPSQSDVDGVMEKGLPDPQSTAPNDAGLRQVEHRRPPAPDVSRRRALLTLLIVGLAVEAAWLALLIYVAVRHL